ncbi:hypothetical protein C0993_007299 [Termitomyces sp. T159_Od127]|nr:hypothetical protein C0993_007299 [Termitomyces sp. T159_Od127]
MSILDAYRVVLEDGSAAAAGSASLQVVERMRASAAQGVQAVEALRMGAEALEREKALVNGQQQVAQGHAHAHAPPQPLQKTEDDLEPTSPHSSVGVGPATGAGAAATSSAGASGGASGGSVPVPAGSGLPPGANANANTNANGETAQTCLGCNATQTPEWRRGPLGESSLLASLTAETNPPPRPAHALQRLRPRLRKNRTSRLRSVFPHTFLTLSPLFVLRAFRHSVVRSFVREQIKRRVRDEVGEPALLNGPAAGKGYGAGKRREAGAGGREDETEDSEGEGEEFESGSEVGE